MKRKLATALLSVLLLAALLCSLWPAAALAAEPEDKFTTVYLDGTITSSGDGTTPETAVSTFAEAKALLSPADGTIYITGMVTESGAETWDLTGFSNARVVREAGFTGYLIRATSGASLTLNHIVIDGNKESITNVNPMINVYVNSSLRLESGAVLQNNAANSIGGGAIRANNNATVNINGGRIINNSSSMGGGVYLSYSSSLIMNNGEISNNSAASGGGIYVSFDCSSIEINGGSMKGNNATGGLGSTIYINAANIKSKLGGSADISGAIYFSLPSAYLNITAALTGWDLNLQTASPSPGLVLRKELKIIISLILIWPN
jgi:hypothetical protein